MTLYVSKWTNKTIILTCHICHSWVTKRKERKEMFDLFITNFAPLQSHDKIPFDILYVISVLKLIYPNIQI